MAVAGQKTKMAVVDKMASLTKMAALAKMAVPAKMAAIADSPTRNLILETMADFVAKIVMVPECQQLEQYYQAQHSSHQLPMLVDWTANSYQPKILPLL